MMVNIADAKAKLSELVEAAWRGEQVIICNRNEPVAELRAVEIPRKTPRDLTPLYPDWSVDLAFFEPLENDDLDAWYGDAAPESGVAERPSRRSSLRRDRRSRR
jgi:antitoxin (DNA-binding transcriptional repressor) of toxin-antitoxin stability system